jgi:hypothetical protein
MLKAHEAICGGHRNFVTAQNAASEVVFYYKTSTGKVLNGQQQYLKQATTRLVNVNGAYSSYEIQKYSVGPVTRAAAQTILAASGRQAAADLGTCNDKLLPHRPDRFAISNMFKYMLGRDVETCDDVRFACWNESVSIDAKVAVRTVCPRACNCHRGQLGAYDLLGCPLDCFNYRKHAMADALIATIRDQEYHCNDYDIIGNSTFGQFFADFQTYLHTRARLDSAYFTLQSLGFDTSAGLAALARQYGCAFVKTWSENRITPSPCTHSDVYLGTASSFCPVSCSYHEHPCHGHGTE